MELKNANGNIKKIMFAITFVFEESYIQSLQQHFFLSEMKWILRKIGLINGTTHFYAHPQQCLAVTKLWKRINEIFW